MILNALVKRYADAGGAPSGWQVREVAYALVLAEDGELLEIRPLGNPDDKKVRKMKLMLPAELVRAGINAYMVAYFLCDDGNFMLGYDARKFESASKLHKRLLADIDTPAAKAIVAYFGRSASPLAAPFAEATKDALTAKYVFEVNGRRVDYDDGGEAIREAWQRESDGGAQDAAGDMLCLVTGEQDRVVRLHDKIKLSGVTMSKQPLISMNDQKSFRSYGAETGDPPAQIGSRASFAYATALNDLLDSPDHHKSLGKDTLVYWAEGGGEAEAAVFTMEINPQPDQDAELASVFAQLTAGTLPNLEGILWQRPFYVLCLSPNAARISVRFFFSDSFGEIARRVAEHYANLAIYSARNEKYQHIPPWMIIAETTVARQGEMKKASDAPPVLGGQLLRAIVTGARYPASIYNAILARIRAGEEVNRTKVAIIKATLLRNYPNDEGREVLCVALNEESRNKAYVLGRLFAVLEKLQKEATDSPLNSTICDQFFSTASASPGSVFPFLMSRSVHHEHKLTETRKRYYGKLKQQLLGTQEVDGDAFPNAWTLQDQGRFVLGYYHQIQSFYTTKSDKTNEEDDDDV
ncbi:MAG: type I-C CRISPR-associated protein Cas8c/Csd1 [Oscillospiraceae bacterium]|jgi:CRISPR-associated protein Csd1|nr:type I-C CRISPR-associated protein Cas8c/Csd1 [Oscillospiraceae bacterium]